MGERGGAQAASSAQVRQGLPHRQQAARAGRAAVRRRAHRLGLPASTIGRPIREANTQRIAETFREACDVAEDYGERLAAEGEICWGGMHSWKAMVRLLEDGRTVRRRSASRPTWPTRCCSPLGYNAPEDRILPADFDWSQTAALDEALRDDDRRAAALDHRFPRGAERRHREGLRLARQDRAALPARRSERQAGHRRARPASGCATTTASVTRAVPPHLLGRLHVPQRRDDEAGDVEQHSGRRWSRCARRTAGANNPTMRRLTMKDSERRPGRLRVHGPDPFERLGQGESLLRPAVPAGAEGHLRRGRRQGAGLRRTVGLRVGRDRLAEAGRRGGHRPDRHLRAEQRARGDRHRRGRGRQDDLLREAAGA